uniref:DOMON domain-containing protein n=1 Tax=Globodera pallida TaxID=36090 RepID=A0A183C4B1_GLOPA
MKPKGCTPHQNCAYALSYVADNERVYFELLGQVAANKNAYVALGFSDDGLMGGDTATDCSSLKGEHFVARLSYNPGKSNRQAPLDDNMSTQILHTHFAKHSDGTLYCRFSQLIVPPASVQAQFVRPLNMSTYILMSSGVTHSKGLLIHSLNVDSPLFPFSSEGPVPLTKYQLCEDSAWLRIDSNDELSHSLSSPNNSTQQTHGAATAALLKQYIRQQLLKQYIHQQLLKQYIREKLLKQYIRQQLLKQYIHQQLLKQYIREQLLKQYIRQQLLKQYIRQQLLKQDIRQ